jgi:hypothetical protein
MAQLSGVMTADFSDFMFEIDKSVVKLKDLEGAAGYTNQSIDDFSQGLSAADKTLGALGIHIGPQIQALRELGTVAGLTFEKLGLWGSAGLAASVGVATYELTKMTLEWSGLNQVISESITKLLGWGDVAAARAGAGMDVLNRATQIAGRTITDFDQAMQIIKEHNLAVAESFNTGASRVRRWGEDIAKVRNSGDLETIMQELRDGTSTVKQLAERFQISGEAITWHTNRMKENSATLAKWHADEAAALEKSRKAQDELNNAGLGWQNTVAAIAPATAAMVQHYLNLGVSVESLSVKYGLTATQVEALDRQMKFNLETMAVTEPAIGSLDQWITSVGKQFAVAAESGDQFKTMLELTGEAAEAVVPKLDTVFRSVTQAASVAPGASGAPGASAGGSQFWGAGAHGTTPITLPNVTYGPGLEAAFAQYSRTAGFGGGGSAGAFTHAPYQDFITWALERGLATRAPTVTNTFNIVDTESGIARRVGDTITSQMQRGSLVN